MAAASAAFPFAFRNAARLAFSKSTITRANSACLCSDTFSAPTPAPSPAPSPALDVLDMVEVEVEVEPEPRIRRKALAIEPSLVIWLARLSPPPSNSPSNSARVGCAPRSPTRSKTTE